MLESDCLNLVEYEKFESWNSKVIEDVNKSNLVVLAWWPKIIPRDYLSQMTTSIVNMHPSFLPNGRGKNPNFWAIVDESKFGVTLHQIDEKIDAGFIIDQIEINYDWTDTGETLYNKAIISLKILISKFLAEFADKQEVVFKSKIDDVEPVRFAKDIDPKRKLDLDESYKLREILNIVRASTFSDKPGASFVDAGEEYEVRIRIERKTPKK
jgi:methionyl-tRNA formyltransferase